MRTEFRYNRKRKHYSYIYGFKGDYRQNLLLSTKPTRNVKRFGKTKIKNNVKLSKHPNPKSNKQVYIINQRYLDHKNSFGNLLNWLFSTKEDRKKAKKIKKGKWK